MREVGEDKQKEINKYRKRLADYKPSFNEGPEERMGEEKVNGL